MEKEFWGALVDAIVLIVSALAAHFLESSLADLIVQVITYAQPVVVIILLKMYADRKVAEVRAEIVQVMKELGRR